jgi:signal transduction histidine kinase
MKNKDKFWYLIMLLLGGLLLQSVNTYAADKVLETSVLDQEPVSLTVYLQVLEDPSQTLTFADVQKPDVASRFKGDNSPAAALNYGYTDSAYWLRLSLSNTGDRPAVRMLELDNPELEHIQFFQPDKDGAYRSVVTGGVLPFATRPYLNNNYVFPITLEEHSRQVFYLRINSHRVTIPARLWTPQAFHVKERNYYIGQAWYFGMVTAMVIFYFFIFLVFRSVIYLHYVGFVICAAFVIATQNGLTKEFLPFDSYKWSSISFSISYSLSMFASLVVTRSMLSTRYFVPRLDRLLKIFAGLFLLNILANITQEQIFVKTLTLLVFSSLMLTMVTVAYCALRRQRIAYFAIVAFTLPTLGSVMMVLRNLQILPSNALTSNGLQIGSALEMLLLAFALADRFNMIRRKAMNDVKQANAYLEERLKVREAELTATHTKLREVEQRQTLTQERQRLMQDMHDGLGSSLVSALRVVEHGRMNEGEVALVLKGCIDDLKLAIDSMEPVEADLLLLLATFRYRLGPRLENTGITLHWEVKSIPKIEWLDPKNALHILRILQEVFTNIIKHTQATIIRVATCVEHDHVVVTIVDNGQGFDLEQALERGGKGLSNQMRRAESIGAEIKWKSNNQGTCCELWLPIWRRQLVV